MLNHLDDTFRDLIYTRGNISKSDVDIEFDQPSGEWASQIGKPTLNCWCFDVRENIRLRNNEIGQRVNGTSVQMRMPSLRFDFTYLVTAWASHIADEHQLLWRALATFTSLTALQPDDCQGDLRNQEYEIPLTVAQASDVINNLSELWGVLDNQMHLGFTVTATLALDTKRGFEAPMVFASTLRFGTADAPERTLDALDREIAWQASEQTARDKDQQPDQVTGEYLEAWKHHLSKRKDQE